jgi:hypothetical protein
MKTIVIYRTFKTGGDTIALFPCEPADSLGENCQSYMHVGQHGAASPAIMRGSTRPATRNEIAPLAKELQRNGYDLKPMKKFPRNAMAQRREVIHRILYR